MNIVSKGAHSMRIIALPLSRARVSPDAELKPLDLVFYHFDLVSPNRGRRDLSWHKKALKKVVDKATDVWAGLGKAPKGSWKLWTYELGERIANQVEFEEMALRNVDPSMGPAIPTSRTSTERVDDVRKARSHLHPHPKIPLIYPPSVYPTGAGPTLNPSLAHLQTFLASRGPQHRRGFYLWMLIAPLTAPITLIPVIPNLPFFFCVWRSWSHYRVVRDTAHRSSQYLSSLLDCGLIEPNPSFELDQLYTLSTSASRTSLLLPPPLASRSSEKTSTFENVAPDGDSEAAPGTGASTRSTCILTMRAIPSVLEMFRLPESTGTDIHRAMNQASVRAEQSP